MTWEGLSPPYATIVADPPWPYEGEPLGWKRPPTKRAGFLPYSPMSLEAIRALPMADLAAPGAYLWLWATQRYLFEAEAIAEAWGWRYGKTLVWCKQPMSTHGGGTFTSTTEFLLYCRRPIGAMLRAARKAVGLSSNDVHQQVCGGTLTGLVRRWELDNCYPSPEQWRRLRELLPALHGLADLPPSPMVRFDTTWWLWPRGPHSAKPPAFLDLVEQVSPAPRVELFARAQRLGWDSWGWGYEGVTA